MVKNTPVIIGAAQITQRKDVDLPVDPLTLIANATKKAIAISGVDLNKYPFHNKFYLYFLLYYFYPY